MNFYICLYTLISKTTNLIGIILYAHEREINIEGHGVYNITIMNQRGKQKVKRCVTGVVVGAGMMVRDEGLQFRQLGQRRLLDVLYPPSYTQANIQYYLLFYSVCV